MWKIRMWGRANMLMLALLFFSLAYSVSAKVWYDYRAIKINDQRRILLSGGIHYPRSTPEVTSPKKQPSKSSIKIHSKTFDSLKWTRNHPKKKIKKKSLVHN